MLSFGPKEPRTAIDSLTELQALLSVSPLADRDIAELDVLDTGEKAFALEISGAEVESAWRIARELLPQTARWPVVSTFWSGSRTSWPEKLAAEDFFSRFYYEEAPNTADVSPRGLIAAAERVDPQVMLEALLQERDRYESVEEALEYQLEDTLSRYGSVPTAAEIANAELNGSAIQTPSQLERWLLDWELKQEGSGKPEYARQDWFVQDPSVLLWLPTPHSWETLAYLNWYGTSDFGSEYYIALGKQWTQQYGAELVAHYGTMLQYFVSQPPATPEQAWELAIQQDLVAPCTLALPGISVRNHAIGLVNYNRWFLHERP